MIFKHLGRFAVLAVCFFAIAIVMVGCGGDDDPPIVPPPPEETKEKTFKEQLVEGSWRTLLNGSGESLDSVAKAAGDEFSQIFGEPMTGRISQNNLRFENSGKVTMTYGVKLAPAADPANALELIYKFTGSYWIIEDLGSSATMTLSLTEIDVSVAHDDADVAAIFQEILDAEDFGGLTGDLLNEERAAINGDQLRLGEMNAERVN